NRRCLGLSSFCSRSSVVSVSWALIGLSVAAPAEARSVKSYRFFINFIHAQYQYITWGLTTGADSGLASSAAFTVSGSRRAERRRLLTEASGAFPGGDRTIAIGSATQTPDLGAGPEGLSPKSASALVDRFAEPAIGAGGGLPVLVGTGAAELIVVHAAE